MLKVVKEVLREYVRNQNFEPSEQVLEAMKEIFKEHIARST